MSDYSKTTNFTAKDSLSTGDPAKLIKGANFDTEFDALVTAVNSKLDSTDYASTAEAQAESVTNKVLSPSHFADWSDDNGGMVGDIQALADPGNDTLLGWDDTAGAVIGFTFGDGLTFAAGLVELEHLGIQDLEDAGADKILFWDDGASKCDWLLPRWGLEFSGTNFQIANQAVSSTVPVKFTSGVLGWSSASLTELAASGVTQAQDGMLVSNNGAINVMPWDQAGLPVVTADAAQTFGLADMNTIQVLTGSTNRVWTIPKNTTTALEIGAVIILVNSGTGNLTITAAANVIIDSVFHTAAATAQSDRVLDGGTAALIKTAVDTWSLAGDIANS